MPVFDAYATNWVNPGSSASWTHTCAAGASLILQITTAVGATGISATYNGVALTQIDFFSTGVLDYYIFKLANPASGAHTLNVTGVSGVSYIGGWSFSFTGCDASNPVAAVNHEVLSTASTSYSHSITSTQANEMLLSFAANDVNVTVNNTGTFIYHDGSVSNGAYAYLAAASPGSQVISFSKTGGGAVNFWYSWNVLLQSHVVATSAGMLLLV